MRCVPRVVVWRLATEPPDEHVDYYQIHFYSLHRTSDRSIWAGSWMAAEPVLVHLTMLAAEAGVGESTSLCLLLLNQVLVSPSLLLLFSTELGLLQPKAFKG